MERKWTSLNGKEYSFTVEQVVAEFNPAFQQRYSGYGKEYSISSADAMQALITWEMHQLDPYIDGWFVPKKGGAVYIVGYMFILKKVGQLPYYDGFDQPKDIFDKHGNLIAVEVSVWRKDRTRPTTWRVEFDEFAARKKDGSLNEMWQTKGKFMLRKVGVVIPHRIAFAAELQNLYIAEEFGNDDSNLTTPRVTEPVKTNSFVAKITPPNDQHVIQSVSSNDLVTDEEKVAGDWAAKISKTETLSDLEKIGVGLKESGINFSKDVLKALKSVYKQKYNKLKEVEDASNKDLEMEDAVDDYEHQELVQDLLNNYNPDNDTEIQTAIDSIKDKNTKKVLQKAFNDLKKKNEGGNNNASIKEK